MSSLHSVTIAEQACRFENKIGIIEKTHTIIARMLFPPQMEQHSEEGVSHEVRL